jgi:4-amino-4-deoxy-L-arabinose transferase-like glycosyltransferase
MRRHRQWLLLGVAVVAVSLLATAMTGPVRHAVQIGGDEGFEVSKGLLVAKGYKLYKVVWDDQPALHTVLLATAFKLFGASIAVGRSVAVCFGVSFLAGFFVVVRGSSGRIAAFVAVLCLSCSPHVLELVVSVMLEAPAVGTALWALWPILRWKGDRQPHWLVLSGSLLALALQIKLTAGVAAPAIAAEVLFAAPVEGSGMGVKKVMSSLALWAGSLVCAYFGLNWALGGVGYDLLWAEHFSSQALGRLSTARGATFWPRLLLDHSEATLGAAAAVCVSMCRRDCRCLSFPLVWMATVTLVHFEHRPWWWYYYLHFAVPLAWLSGYAVAKLHQMVTPGGEWGRRSSLQRRSLLVVTALLVLTLAAVGSARFIREVARIRALPLAERSLLVSKMKQYAPGTKWVYTRSTIYAFHAGLLIIPELAVLPMKRFWSGQITQHQIFDILKHRAPEQLLLSKSLLPHDQERFLAAEFTLVYEDDDHFLYVAKALAGSSAVPPSLMGTGAWRPLLP